MQIVVAFLPVKYEFLKIVFRLFFETLWSDWDDIDGKRILAVPRNFFDRSRTLFRGSNLEKKQNMFSNMLKGKMI